MVVWISNFVGCLTMGDGFTGGEILNRGYGMSYHNFYTPSDVFSGYRDETLGLNGLNVVVKTAVSSTSSILTHNKFGKKEWLLPPK